MRQILVARLFQWPIRCCCLLALAAGSPLLAVAQTAPDTTRIRYSEEMIPDSVATAKPLKQTYSKLARLQIEEKTLWKLGLNNLTRFVSDDELGAYYVRRGVHLIYERKLRPEVSVMVELSPDFSRHRRAVNDPLHRAFSVRSQLAGRYYYNLSQRIMKGKSASNFSANYLSLVVGNGFGRHSHETPFYFYKTSTPFVRTDLSALFGMQRRLSKYCFIDFNVGASTRLTPKAYDLSLSGLLRIGLALGK